MIGVKDGFNIMKILLWKQNRQKVYTYHSKHDKANKIQI